MQEYLILRVEMWLSNFSRPDDAQDKTRGNFMVRKDSRYVANKSSKKKKNKREEH